MRNGFLIEISNTTDYVQQIQLFSEELPVGVIVRSFDGAYNYVALHKISVEHGFSGNSITTNADQPIQLHIHNDGINEPVELNGRLERENISIDSNDNYIVVACPAKTIFTLRLFSILEGMI